MAAEGRNRLVLGDIGNMVTLRGAEGKQQLPQGSRPSQGVFVHNYWLMHKLQQLTRTGNVLVLLMWMELLLQMEVPRKPPPQKRATVKPIKPEAVKPIDTKEEVKEKNSLHRKAAAEFILC
nr:G2/mitotic-specific cyclin S13-7-like isoform X1 [Ipomoea batatas]